VAVLIAAALLVFSAAAQEIGISAEITDRIPPLDLNRFLISLSDETIMTHDRSDGKRFQLGGPLEKVFKRKKWRDVPRRIVSLVNPFSPEERATTELRPRGNLNPRAWSTLVGLHPGQSSFPDARTHESTLGLVSISK